MTDFQFINSDATINVTLRTDFIGATAAITGGENVTICDIIGVNTAPAKALFANWHKINYTTSVLKAFAIANSLTLNAMSVSRPSVVATVLVP
jgi:hypothetical protein